MIQYKKSVIKLIFEDMAGRLKMKLASNLNFRFLFILLALVSVFSVYWFFSSGSHSEKPLTKFRTVNLAEESPFKMESDGRILPEGEAMEVTEVGYEPPFGQRIVHIDLKGAPPKLAYLLDLFPLLKKLGATGVLLEYEDMFPYSGDLQAIPAGNAYSHRDIQQLNSAAKENGLEIIPLVQTFGHLEFLLKLENFQHLREVPEMPLVVCPSQNQTLLLLQQMLSQVMDLHPHSTRLHIGADEVYGHMIGKCHLCRERLSSHFWDPSNLFLSHVINVATFVRQVLNREPLMWDDEFRSISENELVQSGVGNLVSIVVWNYTPVLQIRSDVWSKYLNVFNSIWVASAFKGATGSDQIVTDVQYHMQNHLAWMSFMMQHRDSQYRSKLAGIMLTGWSRYDHFAILCELLPVSLPSLAYNLLMIQHGYNMGRLHNDVNRLLDCRDGPSDLLMLAASGTSNLIVSCQFPGAQVFGAVLSFAQVRQQYYKMLNNSVVRGWMSDFNIAHRFSSPAHLRPIANELFFLKNNVDAVLTECRASLESIYDPFTSAEWTQTYIQPIQTAVDRLIEVADNLTAGRHWPKRPF